MLVIIIIVVMMRGKMIGTVTTQMAEFPTNHDSFPDKNKNLFSSPKCPDRHWAQLIPYSKCYLNSFSEGKSSSVCEADRIPLS
jgi:hypothetical protein